MEPMEVFPVQVGDEVYGVVPVNRPEAPVLINVSNRAKALTLAVYDCRMHERLTVDEFLALAATHPALTTIKDWTPLLQTPG